MAVTQSSKQSLSQKQKDLGQTEKPVCQNFLFVFFELVKFPSFLCVCFCSNKQAAHQKYGPRLNFCFRIGLEI